MKVKLKFTVLILFAFVKFFPDQNVFAQNNSAVATITDDSTQIADSMKYIPLHKFIYAGSRRFTIDGSMPLRETRFRPVTAGIVGGIYLGSLVGLHLYQQRAWWSNNRTRFHFQEDWQYALQVDKAGHIFGGYLTAYFLSEGLTVSGINWNDANIYGAALALLYQTYIETEDGFARDWGFSPSDWYFNVLGPIFFLAQHYVPALQNITPKWQYVPSEWTGSPVINRPRTFIDDYNSSTFWYSVKMNNVISNSWKKYWIPWLNIAFGYGADAIDAKIDPNGPPDQLARRRYIIALDYDLVELLPEGGHFWNWLKQTLNFIKLPSPAVEFTSKGTRFYVLYPFKINLGGINF